jgi:hypothetical protein
MSTRTLAIDICTCGHPAGNHRLWIVSRMIAKDYLRGDYDADGNKDCLHDDCQCKKFVEVGELRKGNPDR